MIYLDGAATTPVLPCVKYAILDALSRFPGNPSSLHSSGTAARELIESVREKIASFLNASPEEIIFVSGATEGNNTIFHSFEGKSIHLSPYEHPSVKNPAAHYCKITKTPKTAVLVSHQLANNETGTLFDLNKFAKSLDKCSARPYFHTDATQAVGKIKIDVKSLNVDYLTFSAHKLGGPLGIGILYKRSSAPLSPLIYGGNQEFNFRAGTVPTFLIAGLGAALDYIEEKNLISLYETTLRPLRNYLEQEIKEKIPNVIINSNHEKENSLAGILNVSFPGAEGESIQLRLDLEKGIEVSTGSACASGEPSSTLLALTGDPELAHSSIRFTLDFSTKREDIDELMSVLPRIVSDLRSISTYTPAKKGKNV